MPLSDQSAAQMRSFERLPAGAMGRTKHSPLLLGEWVLQWRRRGGWQRGKRMEKETKCDAMYYWHSSLEVYSWPNVIWECNWGRSPMFTMPCENVWEYTLSRTSEWLSLKWALSAKGNNFAFTEQNLRCPPPVCSISAELLWWCTGCSTKEYLWVFYWRLSDPPQLSKPVKSSRVVPFHIFLCRVFWDRSFSG